MSLLSRFLPHALCCFYPPADRDHEETRPSTGQDVPPSVAPKSAPYVMINVPHQPSTMDEHAFRRMMTASPACPIEAGPISNAQRRTQHKKRRKQLSTHDRSLDISCSFNSGRTMPAADSSTPGMVKQQISMSRLGKRSSKEKSRDSVTSRTHNNHKDTTDHTHVPMLALSAQSTGLCDVLTPRDPSFCGYDSDAKVIKTPEIDNVTVTVDATPKRAQQQIQHLEVVSKNSISSCRPSILLTEAPVNASPIPVAQPSPYLCTPERASFVTASTPELSESSSKMFRRSSAGIGSCNGIVESPTNLGLHTSRASMSSEKTQKSESSLPVPLGWTSTDKEPDTPQTVMRRLSNIVGSDVNGEPERESPSQIRHEGRRASLVAGLDSALLEHLSMFSDAQPLDLALTPTPLIKFSSSVPETVLVNVNAMNNDQPTSSKTRSPDLSRTDVASMISVAPSEHRSVHLFNMDIPGRLESKSNATFFSPAVSTNNSKHSLVAPPPLPAMTQRSPAKHISASQSGRAEHNRKPSDPRTRHLFEQPNRRRHPYWKASDMIVNRSKVLEATDDTSSVYSSDFGAPPSTSKRSSGTSQPNPKRNINSLAIGGRSASTEIPFRRSSQNHSCNLSASQRSVSATRKGPKDKLNAAFEVINRYYDGENEAANKHRSDSLMCESAREIIPLCVSLPDNAINANDFRHASETIKHTQRYRFSAEWTTPAQRSVLGDGVSTYSSTKPSGSMKQRTVHDPHLKESATDLWNRAYREARVESRAADFLSKSDSDMDDLYHTPCHVSPRLRHRSSSVFQTPKSALRRSQSAGPVGRQSLREDELVTDGKTGRLAKSMKRLSFWQLKPQRQQNSPIARSPKFLGRSDGEVGKRMSFTTFERDRAMRLRAAHTPPLSHYLGYWGSFPSHARAARNGPAGEPDNVLARNFGEEQPDEQPAYVLPKTLRSRISASTLSVMQNTSKMFFPGRSNKPDHGKSQSGSPVTRSLGDDVHPAFPFKRWRRHYSTKSPEQQIRMNSNPRTSISPKQPDRLPELDRRPGEESFGEMQDCSKNFNRVENESLELATSPVSDGYEAAKATAIAEAAIPSSEHEKINASSTWESVIFPDVSELDVRMKENTEPTRVPSEAFHGMARKGPGEKMATLPRTSKDLKMPGGFEQ